MGAAQRAARGGRARSARASRAGARLPSRVLIVAAGLVSAGTWGRQANAQSLSLEPPTARAVARAGAGLVADDSSAAWWQNPAAAARRTSARVVLGVVIVDPDLEIEPFAPTPSPVAVSRANSGFAPLVAASVSSGCTTFGVSLLSGQRIARRFEAATRTAEVNPLRYAGLAGVLRRETLTAGVARRLTEALAVGLSVGVSRVALRESRRVWAGIDERDEVGSPDRDLELTITGTDWFVPSASAGLVFVPEDSALELAAGVTLVSSAQLRGPLRGRTPDELGPRLLGAPTGDLELPGALVLRTGARWQGARWSAELDGQLELVPGRGRALRWQLDRVEIVDASGLVAEPSRLASQLSLRSLASLRGAAEVEVLESLLWLTSGVGWSPSSTSAVRVTPGFADLGGSTLAFGAELAAGGVAVSLGVSRTWSRSVVVTESLRRLDNPFGAGDASTGFGAYRATVDLVGISIEVEQR